MVLSFHPNVVAHQNILCAGRLPDKQDEAVIAEAQAVILPQGPSEPLYRMCRRHCTHIFPNYDGRFDYPGKAGQVRLFERFHAPFPATFLLESVAAYRAEYGQMAPLAYPCIFKSNWGGEGDGVYFIEDAEAMGHCLDRAEKLEKGGQKGFLLQEFIRHGGRNLRVVVIGENLYSYWRQQNDDSQKLTNVRTGAVIDHLSDKDLQEAGREAVFRFCRETGINLAGFDLLFPVDRQEAPPLFLEINYFFGRRGLGGSENFYDLFQAAVTAWLHKIGLSL